MTHPLALIVEDDPDLGIIFSQALKTVEFKTELINDGNLALNRLKEVVPSVVVLDLHLPHVSGDKILQAIRADNRLDNTRIIVATADSLRAEALESKVDLVLLKPISFVQLRDLAARLRPPTS